MGEKKVFFCARTGFDEPGAWCELWDEAKVREYVTESLRKAGVGADTPFKTLRVEIHRGSEEDGRLYIWGEDQPGFQAGDYGDHEGLKVEVDGVVVYNDLRPAGDDGEIADHDPDCEDCAQARA
jgi:hypothetical protein